MKTPEMMLNERWCEDCICDFSACLRKGICQGYKLEINEKEENNDSCRTKETV